MTQKCLKCDETVYCSDSTVSAVGCDVQHEAALRSLTDLSVSER